MLKLLKLLLLLGTAILTGCATVSGPADPRDPLESYNRAAYAFNDGFDRYLLKPVAKGYDTITPAPVQKGVGNFFSNLDDILVMFNDLLQFKLIQFASDTGRFLVNSTLGLGGLIDWASDMGMPKHNEDFGQTLGYWGVPEGPYFVMPFLGPSTVRDAPSTFVDAAAFDPVWLEFENGYPLARRDSDVSWGLTALKFVDARASLLKAENIMDEAALDEYTFIREVYLQRRLNLVYDGSPPEEPEVFDESELFDFDEPATDTNNQEAEPEAAEP